MGIKTDKYYLSQFYSNGNENHLAFLLLKHKGYVMSVILKKVKDSELAQDIFQDTLIKTIKTIKDGKFSEQEGKFKNWFAMVARNNTIDYFRRKKSKDITIPFSEITDNQFDFLERHDIEDDTDMVFDREELLIKIKGLVNELPEKFASVIRRSYFEKKKFSEIAEEDGISVNTALGRCRYAIIHLKRLLGVKITGERTRRTSNFKKK
jgi:RNA polymerase sigma-70 factor, ECF subfamily